MDDGKKQIDLNAIQATARKAIADVVRKWRSEGFSDSIIERKLGRPMPSELRR